MPNDPFVDVGELPALGPLRYLDVRDQAAFDAGHAPGAVRVPLDELCQDRVVINAVGRVGDRCGATTPKHALNVGRHCAVAAQ